MGDDEISDVEGENDALNEASDEQGDQHDVKVPSSAPDHDDHLQDAAAVVASIADEELRGTYLKGLYVFSALYVTFLAGGFFGWGPMQLLLESDEAFASQCDNSSQNVTEPGMECPEQIASLLNVHFVASMAMICSPVMGHLADVRGPLALMILTSFLGCLGLILAILSRTFRVDELLYVAFFGLSLTASASSVMVVETGMAYTSERGQQRVIGSLNNLFDAGSITYLILWEIYRATGASVEIIISGYLGFAIFAFGGAVTFWMKLLRLPPPPPRHDDELDADMTIDTDEVTGIAPPVVEVDKQKQNNPEARKAKDRVGETTSPEGYVLIADRPPWQQIRSSQMLLLIFFFAFHTCRNMFTLTTAKDTLEYMGDENNTYLTIFTLLMPASILGFPVVDAALNRYGYHFGLQLVNLLAAIHGTIQLSTDNLNVQVVGFVVFSFYRSFLFFVVFAFLPLFMARNLVGKAQGLMLVAAGLASFINIPLGNAATYVWDGNFFIPILIYTISIAPVILATCCIGFGIRREAQAKATLKESRRLIVRASSVSLQA